MGFKGPFLRLWSWEEVDVLCHHLMSPSGQHNTHRCHPVNSRCLEEWQPVFPNYFVCLWVTPHPHFFFFFRCSFCFSGLLISDIPHPDGWGSAQHARPASQRLFLPTGFARHPTKNNSALSCQHSFLLLVVIAALFQSESCKNRLCVHILKPST